MDSIHQENWKESEKFRAEDFEFTENEEDSIEGKNGQDLEENRPKGVICGLNHDLQVYQDDDGLHEEAAG